MFPLTRSDDVRTPWGYEMKFLVPDAVADDALAWAETSLAEARLGEANLPEAIRVRSLYFDTPDLDIYHRAGKRSRRKWRVRRCGEEPVVALERKTKANGRVRERRSIVVSDDLPRLAAAHETPGWAGDWFHHDLLQWRLEPVCRIDYERLIRAGVIEGQAVRLSVDRCVRCAPASAIRLTDENGADSAPFLSGNVVEIRFAHALPAALKALLRRLDLTPRGVSKYRLGVEACGGDARAR